MNKEIIEKIQKLLSLASSDNQNEAELASKKAQELLIKYNLSMAQVEIKEYDTEQIEVGRDPSDKFINDILMKFFFVYPFKSGKFYVFNGTKENLQVAMYVRSFLKQSFKSLYKIEAKKENWSSGSNRNAFYLGLWKGLKEQLTINQTQHDTGNALMVVTSKLANHVKSRNKIRQTTSNVKSGNQDAVNLGFEQGKNLKISKGLEQKNTNSTQVFLK
jgi:hypothetical protein